ncbi:MAG: PAS domain-containing protein [Deltaproteobacteria bacterium]|nr:PAS domain-containing protein [Deltaproteobacteria bacterium]
MSLRHQFFLLLFSCVAALLVFAGVMDTMFVRLRTGLLQDAVEAQEVELRNRVQASSTRDLEQAAVFTQIPAVIAAYEVAGLGDLGDEADPHTDRARELLRTSLAPYLQGYEAATGQKLKLQFHLPDASSLVRLWRPVQLKRGGEWVDVTDPMGDFRHMVREKNLEPGQALGIELGRSGFTLHGLLPITHPVTRKHLGTVEVVSGFTPVFKTLISSEQEHLALYMNAEMLPVTHALQDPAKYPPVGTRYVALDSVGKGGADLSVDEALLDQGRDHLAVGTYHGTFYGVFPVLDYSGQQVGVVLYVPDGEASASLLFWIRATMYGGLITFMLMFGVVGNLFIERIVVRTALGMTEKMRAIVEDRADMSDRLDESRKNELGDLARAFNALLAKLQGMMFESERLSSYLKDLPTPVFTVDKDMRLGFVNKVALQFLGRSEEQVVGHSMREFMQISAQDQACAATQSMAERRVITQERAVEHATSDEPVHVRITSIPVFDQDQQLDGALLFLVDLSQVYEIVEELQMSAEVLSASSHRLTDTAGTLQQGAMRMRRDSSSVQEGTRTVAGTLSGIMLSADEMSMAVSTAAAAVEEMSSTLTEVAENTAKGAMIASDVDASAEAVGIRVGELSELVVSIGHVVGLIDEIAGKTNLVALNATIEGARAGAAGRGFSVVASEVKGLARQTAQATEEIQKKIARVQEATRLTVEDVRNINAAISELAIISQTNAAAVEEQSSTIKEISHTISTTSASAEEIAEFVRGASTEAETVAAHIEGMGLQIEETADSAELTHSTADQISQVTQRMKEIVGRFERE